MNQNSYICRFIAENNNWRELLSLKGISVKESENFMILNYGIECDFTDPVVQEARGIIIDTETSEVVCWPFRKFGNYGEGYADDIDWNTARVQEKIDGSIVKLWYDHKAGRWQWSTNSMINAADAHVMDGAVSFMDLIRRAENYKDIPFDNLVRDKTYIFELVASEQKIVIRYEYPYLYHIGTRSNISGQESNDDIGIRKPAEYPLHSLRECIKAAETLNQNGENIEHEGFVVADADWHRIKVKAPEYVYAHRVASCHVFTKKRILPMFRINDGSLEELIKTAPDSEVYVRYYQWRYAELKKAVGIAISKARAMYEELEHDRKAIAGYLKNEPLQTFCFKALGNNLTAAEILAGMSESMINRLIEDYKVQENRNAEDKGAVPNGEVIRQMGDRDWRFEGTPWEFIHMVRHACVVYEYVREKKPEVMDILTDEDVFQRAADELGITYEAVKAEMRRNLDFADRLDELMEENKSM